ncbi:GntR family transcriptional regulator [Mangrovicoccus ximenensis]|uniref:GntR family transcriptional regulator n=1 Tax=Mangrovicoccus ximenensis TaxID=1911570 RepID=UPI000D3B2F4C|nr:GntR family transcriptional regulator [Mangrovicoccus ximenensis]
MAEEEPRGTPSQVSLAVELLRDRIIDLTLPPGSRIDERLLIDRFGLGRTPAREALNRLAAEGFVLFRPNRGGAVVQPLDFREFEQLIEAHQFCEGMLAHRCRPDAPGLLGDLRDIQDRYAATVAARDFLEITRLNAAFHMRMYATMENALIEDFARQVHARVMRVLNYTYQNELADPAHQDAQFELNLAQHEDILDAMAAGDRGRFAALLVDHGGYVSRRLVHLLERRRVALVPDWITPGPARPGG